MYSMFGRTGAPTKKAPHNRAIFFKPAEKISNNTMEKAILFGTHDYWQIA